MSQPSLFGRPSEPSGPAPSTDDWTELTWTNGRRYRWRLDLVREYEHTLDTFVDQAPGTWRWELSVLGEDDTWRPVRLCTRRDEIWQHVRGSIL